MNIADWLRMVFDPEQRKENFRRWIAEQGHQCEYRGHGPWHGPCEGPIEAVRPMTSYGDEPEFIYACRQHAMEYVEFWTEQWREYYASVL
jgi:hypothetical protein